MAVYRAVCDATPQGDDGLRALLARVCAEHIGQIVGGGDEEEGKWVEALEEDGGMVLEVLRRLGRRGEGCALGKMAVRGDAYPWRVHSFSWGGL